MKIEFSNRAYERSHGKMPKGTGMWGFALHSNPEPDEMQFFYGSLTQAKAQAKAHYAQVAQQNGTSLMTIYIMP